MREWSSPLFGCYDDMGLCVKTYFCPCVVAGENSEKAKMGSCAIYGCLSILGIFGVFSRARTRETVREQNGIEGSFCHDCLIAWLCPLCSIIQVSRELSNQGESMGQSMSRV